MHHKVPLSFFSLSKELNDNVPLHLDTEELGMTCGLSNEGGKEGLGL